MNNVYELAYEELKKQQALEIEKLRKKALEEGFVIETNQHSKPLNPVTVPVIEVTLRSQNSDSYSLFSKIFEIDDESLQQIQNDLEYAQITYKNCLDYFIFGMVDEQDNKIAPIFSVFDDEDIMPLYDNLHESDIYGYTDLKIDKFYVKDSEYGYSRNQEDNHRKLTLEIYFNNISKEVEGYISIYEIKPQDLTYHDDVNVTVHKMLT